MKNYKKIIILLFLLVAVMGIAMSAASAKTYSKTVEFKKEGKINKVQLSKGDFVQTHYGKKKYSVPSYKEVNVILSNSLYSPKYFKCDKVKIYFKKISNGKVVTKTYKNQLVGGMGVNVKLPKGYKPSKAVVYYSDI